MITIYGDSLLKFVLYENGKYTSNHEFENRYAEKYGLELDNRSYFGSTAEKAFARMRRDAEKGRPFGEFCVIEFGGNDCSYDWHEVAASPEKTHYSHAEPEAYRKTLREMICFAYEQGAQPILTSLPPVHAERYLSWISRDLPSKRPLLRWSGGAGIFYRRNEYYSMLNMALAREMSVSLVDLRRAFLLERDMGDLLCEDGIHPNREGQRRIYEAFCEYTEKGENEMNTEKRPVDAQSSCAQFRHGFWSLDEEPAVCENCEFYEDGLCSAPKEEKKD